MSADAAGSGAAADPLERRYRRLLHAYPAAHRAEYQDEMLGVLMDSSEPGRRWPSPAEAANLIAGALGSRARRLRVGADAGPWRDVAAVAALLLPAALVLLEGYSLATIWSAHRLTAGYPGRLPAIGPSVYVPPLAWALALAASLAGVRRLAAWLGGAAALAEIGVVAIQYARFGPLFNPIVWPVVTGLATAAALAFGPGARRGFRLLGAVPVGLLGLAALVTLAGRPLPINVDPGWWGNLAGWLITTPAGAVVPGVLGLAALLGLRGPVRRRALAAGVALLATNAAQWLVYPVVRLPLPQLSAILATGVATAGLGALLVRLRERRGAA